MKTCADLISPPDYEGPYQHLRFSWGVQYEGEEKVITILSSGVDSDTKIPFCGREEVSVLKARDFWRKLKMQGWIAKAPVGFTNK